MFCLFVFYFFLSFSFFFIKRPGLGVGLAGAVAEALASGAAAGEGAVLLLAGHGSARGGRGAFLNVRAGLSVAGEAGKARALEGAGRVGAGLRAGGCALGALVNVMETADKAPPWTFGVADLMRNLARRNLL